MKYINKHIALLVILMLGTSIRLLAQFDGGISDGHDKSGVLQQTLNGQQINTLGMYVGGAGDGHSKHAFSGVMDGALLSSLYLGGIGDGHHKAILSSVLDGTMLTVLFKGGAGDGHSKHAFAGVMDGALLSSLYLGGNGDGHDKHVFQGIMDGTSLSGVYMGGSGDGHDKLQIATLLDGITLGQLYGGGPGDGHVKNIFNGVVDGSSLTGIYQGGTGDGFSKRSIEYIFSFPGCTFVVNTDDDGFGSLRYAINCAQPGDTIVFSPLLDHQIIGLTSDQISIAKDLHVLHNALADLSIDASIIERAFSIELGQEVVMSGLKIIAGNGADGTGILNNGLLTLINLTIVNTGNGAPAITSTGSSVITIEGTVQVQ